MSVTAQDVRGIADAYRAALRTADAELADSPVEKKLLVAQVAGSAQAIRAHLHTRVPDGDLVGAALDDLIPELQKEDVAGNTLAALQQSARAQAMALVTAVVTGGAWPAWVGTALAVVAGALAFSFDAGQVAGGAMIALVGVGGSVLYGMVRAFAVAGPAVARALGTTHSSLWSAVDSLGDRAERVFSAVVRPELVRAFGPGEGPEQPPAGTAVSTGLKAVVVLTYAFLFAAVVYFGLGVAAALEAWTAVTSPTTTLPGAP